jgi:hypothetical protein
MTAPPRLPPAPLWDWRDRVVCCIYAPHHRIIVSKDWKFLWWLDRRNSRFVPDRRQFERLERIVAELDRWALDNRIAWP